MRATESIMFDIKEQLKIDEQELTELQEDTIRQMISKRLD